MNDRQHHKKSKQHVVPRPPGRQRRDRHGEEDRRGDRSVVLGEPRDREQQKDRAEEMKALRSAIVAEKQQRDEIVFGEARIVRLDE